MNKIIFIELIVLIAVLITNCDKFDSDIIQVTIKNSTEVKTKVAKIYAYYWQAVTTDSNTYSKQVFTDSLAIDTITAESTKTIYWNPELTSCGSGAFVLTVGDLSTSFGYNEGSTMYVQEFNVVVYNDSIVSSEEWYCINP